VRVAKVAEVRNRSVPSAVRGGGESHHASTPHRIHPDVYSFFGQGKPTAPLAQTSPPRPPSAPGRPAPAPSTWSRPPAPARPQPGRQVVPVPEESAVPRRPLKRGSRVRHPTLGSGVVLELEGQGDEARITVFFEKAGKRKLVAKFANLEML